MPSAAASAASVAAILAAALLSACDRAPPPASAPIAHDTQAFQRGVGLMGQFDFTAARAEFEKLAQSDPAWREARLNLAIATLNRQQEGDSARALEMLRPLAAEKPSDPRARYVLAIALLHSGKPAEAEPLFREVAAGDPADPYPPYFAAQSALMQGHNDEALAQFRRAAAIDPQLRSAWYGASQSLSQLGRGDEARQALDEFQRLRGNPVARLAEFKYTRMGPKSEALALQAATPARVPAAGPLFSAPTALAPGGRAPSGATPAISVADLDGDGQVDAIFVAGGAGGASLLLRRDGSQWTAAPDHPLAREIGVASVVWADVDNDGLPDAIVCRAKAPPLLYRQQPRDTWNAATPAAFSRMDGARDCAAFDADHDGDVDLFVVSADGRRTLLNNNLDGTFRDLAAKLPASTAGRARQVVAVDFDNDRDLDLIVIREGGPHEVLENDRTWTYRAAAGFDEFKRTPALAAVAADADGDGQVEIFTLTPTLAVIEWRRGRDGVWTPRERIAGGAPAAREGRLALADLDGDGRPEIVKSEASGWSAWRVSGETAVKVHQSTEAVTAWHVAVLDARGPSIIDTLADGTVRLHAPGPGRSPFVLLSLSGRGDEAQSMRSNASGIGVRIAARIGGRAVTAHTLRLDSGPGQDLAPLAIGLGGDARIDYAAIDWPDGVFQTELDIAPGAPRRIAETQRQLSSCPLVFAWNGERIAFVSDILGVGGLGYLVAPGEYAKPRPWENFLLPAGALAARDGRYVVKIAEPMEEAAYLDQLRLIAYDLPPGWDMALDERMGISPPLPTGQPVFFRGALDPVRATNDRGEDVTRRVTKTDLDAAPTGAHDRRFIGRLAQPHGLTLEFAQPFDRAGATLLVDGWIEYPYSQTMFAAWQAHASYSAPTVEARGADGRWRKVLDEFGYPAGMPRRMSVALARLPAGASALRITTNQEIYFDRIAIVFAEKAAAVKRTELALAGARVAAIGFPKRTTGTQQQPAYDYARRTPLWDVRMQSGSYTAYGDATALVSAHDDAVAIIGPGDELHAEFTALRDEPHAGWTRRFVLESRGWAKDMDLYTGAGDTLEPLPTSGRPVVARERLHAQYNVRHASGR